MKRLPFALPQVAPPIASILAALQAKAAALCVRAFSCFVLPVSCSLCRNIARGGYPLCTPCREKMLKAASARLLLEHEADRCSVCGTRLISAENTCPQCREGDGAFRHTDKVCTLFSYTPANAAALSAWKIAGNRLYSSIFAEILATVFAASVLTGKECKARGIAIVPVPPRPGKIKNTGWDQIEELCRLLRKRYGMPVANCLKRLSAKQQKRLGREERKANIRGQISLKKGKTPPETAILIDDIVTTGATADACAQALKSAGCRFVAVLSLFRDE